MNNDLRKKYISAIASVISVFAITLSVVIYSSSEDLVETIKLENIAILIGAIATAIAGISSFYMSQILKAQKLREKTRRIFIIYAREDLAIAREISDLLSNNGFEPWLDVDQIEAGQIWKEAAEDALSESAVAIVLTSRNLTKNSFAQHELNTAIYKMESIDKKTSPIIPILIDKSDLPVNISHIQAVDFQTDGAKEHLIRSLDGVMRRIMTP